MTIGPQIAALLPAHRHYVEPYCGSLAVLLAKAPSRHETVNDLGWRHYVNPAGSSASMPDYLAGYVDRIAPAVERLQHVSLEARPALDIIARYGQQPDVLLYVDPPYLGSTRTRSWDGYEHEMRSEADHRALAEALHASRAAVVLSGYASDLYDRELYAGWDRHTMVAGTGQGDGWANRVEVLWSNRPLGRQPGLFDLPDLGGA